ncbi:MAG: ATPase, T2SS/T4P/T4SS family [Planctomycetota bacterium]|nr:ATPase, T2SS/T4P/T4SS family [Planctomycetota bacterium]
MGRALRKLGYITREQAEEAAAMQLDSRKGELLGQILVSLGRCDQKAVDRALAYTKGLAYFDLDATEISQDAINAVDGRLVRMGQFVPLDVDLASRKIVIAVKDVNNFGAADNLKQMGNWRRVTVGLAPSDQVDRVIAEKYPERGGSDSRSALEGLGSGGAAVSALEGRGDSVDLAALEMAANDNAVVQLVQKLLLVAIEDKASDIHLEPFEDEFKVRYRIDGVLYDMHAPAKSLATALVSRVKVMSKLDIAERRLPQDGRIEFLLPQGPIDLRVAVLPTMFGESVVLRILDRSNVQLSLDKVGLPPDELEKLRTLINKPNGIVLVTGPTGSGKTTTLYAALNELNDPGVKILTAEDPVEYDVQGLIQCQVNLDQELTFAKLLRSFLRQDPDIILVGEIRDLETAQIAIQASLTGHLVLTTLHTNDAPSTVLRLVDLGVETFLLTATIEAIVAQRLVRRVCVKCKEAYTPNEEQLMELSLRPSDVEGKQFFRGRGKGCDHCRRSGYKGRKGLFEILVMDDDIRELVMKQASTSILRQEARKRGMRTLREAGLMAIYNGETTIDEVVRETMTDE